MSIMNYTLLYNRYTLSFDNERKNKRIHFAV